MKRVRINVPFTDKVTKRDYEANEEIQMTEERIAEIRTVGVNLISVLGDVEEPEEQKEPEKEPETPEIPEEPEEQKEPEEEPEKPKKSRTQKKKEEQ